eukprot:750501-Pyramimonas_sp.AAC.1
MKTARNRRHCARPHESAFHPPCALSRLSSSTNCALQSGRMHNWATTHQNAGKDRCRTAW